jgi:hypothetical protein
MKSTIKQFFVVVAIVATYHIGYTQTPYDDFAPSNKKKEMLKLPETTFKAYNADSTSKIKYIELDKETLALSYYDAKDSLLSQIFLQPSDIKWISVDQMASGRPGLTPYGYCQNNPIMRIDLDGNWDDDYTIDKNGSIKLERRTNDNFDMLYTKESWNNGKKDNFIKLDKGACSGIILGRLTIIDGNNTQSTFNYAVFKVIGDDNAMKMFGFAKDNTNIEWSKTNYGSNEGKDGLSFISTSFNAAKEQAVPIVASYLTFVEKSQIRSSDHNHPGSPALMYPSGIGNENGDCDFAEWINKYNNPNATFRVFGKGDNYIYYDQFGACAKPIQIYGKK